MRIVVALGGNALLERGESPDSDIQQGHVARAVTALAPLLRGHDLLITHGNGPQVGVLALESAEDKRLSHPYPLDALGAQTQGLIGYWLVQAVHRAVPDRPVACLVTRTLVAADDPAFRNPTKFVGPVYTADEAARLARERGWQVGCDGNAWRRVVPSPDPLALPDIATIRMLADAGVTVVCAGGGGVPVIADKAGTCGAEAVVDKDLTAALLAQQVNAEALLLLTDVQAVMEGFGTGSERPIRWATPAGLRSGSFPAGSMGPKVEAVCRFVERTGRIAAIGRLDQATAVLAGAAGTLVSPG
jgi:carbamate kinase